MCNKFVGLLAAALIAPFGASRAALPELPPAPAGQSVSELLMMDARRAIAAEHARHPSPVSGITESRHESPHAYGAPHAPQATSAARPPPLLTSIYGVGNQLHAEVLIDGQEALFASGQSRALTGAPTSWRLKRISPPCVDLESDKAGAMRLCSAKSGAKR